ncbi:SPOSA6832_00501, partial [Sporobolomyces salmonicolor]
MELTRVYEQLLGLSVTCTTDEVKKAYRRLYHPDKNPDDPTAADRFKEIAVAYTTLSDPGLRHTYNEFGRSKKDGGDAEDVVDPEAIFSTLFGGERFQDIIGTISLGSEMKSAMQEAEEEEEEEAAPAPTATSGAPSTSTSVSTSSQPPKPVLTPEQQTAADRKKQQKEEQERKIAAEKAKVREERVKALARKLRDKLALYSEQAQGEEDKQIAEGVQTMWSIEAEELKKESYGVELLHTVGFVYSSKSKHFLAATGPIPFGVGGWFHSAKSTAHIFNQTISTVRSAYALKDVFDAIQAAEKSGLSDDERKKLEDKAAQMGAKLEVESIIREVCDRILTSLPADEKEGKVPLASLRKRAVALGILGDVFMAVKKDPGMDSHGPFGLPSETPPA